MQNSILEVNYENKFAPVKIGNYLSNFLYKNTAIICIGTDRCIIDCLGPLVGTMLQQKNIPVNVFGTLKDPIHAINFSEKMKYINSQGYTNIIAIDACLSNKRRKGIIEIKKGSISPGKGIGKTLPKVGDIAIIGIIDESGLEFQRLLQETRLSFIYEMAEKISQGISIAFDVNNEVELQVAFNS